MTVLELAGIKNVLAKRLGSKTPLNNARAAMLALSQLRTHKSVSRERGISLSSLLLKNHDFYIKSLKSNAGSRKKKIKKRRESQLVKELLWLV